jgi:hypothetical protein
MFLESGYDHIVAETLIQLRDLLRRYPDLGEVRGRGGGGGEGAGAAWSRAHACVKGEIVLRTAGSQHGGGASGFARGRGIDPAAG